MATDPSDIEQARRAAQRAAARKRQAEFRARQRARGMEMITLKVPASMRAAFTRLAARLQADGTTDEALEEALDELRDAAAAWRARVPGDASADAAPPEPLAEAATPEPEPEPHDAWVDLAGLWRSSGVVGSLTDFTVVMADLDGSLYARWTAQQRRPSGFASVDSYARGTRSGAHDGVISTGRMNLGGRDLQFRGVITAPGVIDATLTEHSEGATTVHRALFTRAG